ncbi:O-antigen ligase family protein [Glacieibacterium megasporae]|uniref:O-antigen ligase family protein n=1 Tax=Glacieibacterium megasporae TaxID=2835787 RepID=UPI001C1DD168|nr:O-antigen ligase family protein [Polymorphobacter megasporae]UAJ12688.1 O-antigen ligase family protein [Polymorphobacter megasporae]
MGIAAICGAAAVLLPQQYYLTLVIPIIVLALLSLWMLPDIGRYPAAMLRTLFKTHLYSFLLWPSYVALSLPGLPWITPTRLILYTFSAVLVFSLSVSGDLRQYLQHRLRSSGWIWISFLTWEAIQVVTIPISDDKSSSLTAFINTQVYLLFPLIGALTVFRDKVEAARAINILMVSVVILCFIGLLEYKMQMPPWAEHIPHFLRIDPVLLSTILSSQARSGNGLYRVRATYAVSLLFAEVLAVMIPFFLMKIIFPSRPFVRTLSLISLPLIMFTIVRTQSRLGIVGGLVSTAVYLMFVAFKRLKSHPTSLVAASVFYAAPIGLVLFLGVIASSHTLSQSVLGGGSQAASDASRKEQRDLALTRVLHNPIGYGPGRSGEVLGYVGVNGLNTVDSYVITLLMDTGVIGLLSFGAIFVLTAFSCARAYIQLEVAENDLRAPIAAMLSSFLVIKLVLSETNNHTLMFIMVGLALSLNKYGELQSSLQHGKYIAKTT